MKPLFRCFGSSNELEMLRGQLVARGATETDTTPELILVAASNVATADFEGIPAELRHRCVIVGLEDEVISAYNRTVRPGTFQELLEVFAPLGVLHPKSIRDWEAREFIGPRNLSDPMHAAAIKVRSTLDYAMWHIGPEDSDAAEFLIRLATATPDLEDRY